MHKVQRVYKAHLLLVFLFLSVCGTGVPVFVEAGEQLWGTFIRKLFSLRQGLSVVWNRLD